MAADGSIIIDTKFDTSGIDNGVSRIKQSFNSLGSAVKKIGLLIGGTFAVGKLVQFGKDTPAVGFAIVVDQLMAALSRQQIHIPVQLVNTVILYEPSARQSAVRLSRFFRSEGTPVQAMVMEEGKSLEDYKEMAKKRGLRTILCLKDAGNTVTAFDMLTGNVDETPVSAYGVRGIL